jgi:hypothetical protein
VGGVGLAGLLVLLIAGGICVGVLVALVLVVVVVVRSKR